MAYFYNSNYPQFPDNYQYYPQYNYHYDSTNHVYSRYVQSYDTEFNGNAYQHVPNPSLVGYHYSNYYQPESITSKNNAYFHENGDYDVVSTQYIVYYNTANGEAKANEVFFEEYNPQPFHGGYDINQTYGKPLPPSDDICYPLSKNEVVDNPKSVSSLDDKRVVENEGDQIKQSNEITPSNVIQEGDKEVVDDDDDFDDDGFDDEYDDDDDDDEGFDDGGDGGEGEEGRGEKQDDLSKEPMMVAPIASLGDALDKKEDNKVDEGEKKDDFGDKDPSNEKKRVTFKDDEVHEKDNKDQNGHVGEVIQEETPSKFEAEKQVQEQEQEKYEKDEGKVEEINIGSEVIRRQIPPGYGMESLDLCEGLFGGYFPCLWKRKQRNDAANSIQESGYSYENLSSYDYEYCCKDTVDYLFGNPNPYGGSMPEKGSYGDPVYSYQRYCPQQPVTEQVSCSSMLQNSSYYYGHNGDYYQC